jgi:V/A-type H+-transporting ATPase subunit K
VVLNLYQGWQILIACLPVGLTGLVSGIHQGKVCASGVFMVAKQPKDLMKPVIMAALVETYAVLGLLITILLLNGIKL